MTPSQYAHLAEEVLIAFMAALAVLPLLLAAARPRHRKPGRASFTGRGGPPPSEVPPAVG